MIRRCAEQWCRGAAHLALSVLNVLPLSVILEKKIRLKGTKAPQLSVFHQVIFAPTYNKTVEEKMFELTFCSFKMLYIGTLVEWRMPA